MFLYAGRPRPAAGKGAFYLTYTIENEALRVRLSSLGGAVESIFDKKTGLEHGWKADPRYWDTYTAVCFPVCGGLTDNEYIYNGRTYPMPMHGFFRERELELVSQTPTRVVQCLRDDAQTRAVYPFSFRFLLTQELDGEAFRIHFDIENAGSGEMYFSAGSHLAYGVPIVPGESMQEDYVLQFEGVQKAGRLICENEHITGRTDDIFGGRDYLEIRDRFAVASTILDLSEIAPHTISLVSRKSGARTTVHFEGFRYCILWTWPGTQPFVCIEPWSGMVDVLGHDKDFTKKLGMRCLQPGEHAEFLQSITVG